jgi:hypothetical protein
LATEASITVDFKRQHEDVSGGLDDKGAFTFTVSYLVAWTDLVEFMKQVGGYPSTASTTATIPLQCPYAANLYASSQSVAPMGVGPDIDTPYSHARVTVNFKSTQFDYTAPESYLSEDLRFAGNFITLPGSAYKFGDGTPIDATVGRQVPEVEISLTRHKLYNLDIGLITALTGKVNSTTFVPSKYNCPPGTVLFAGASTRTDFAFGSLPVTDLTLSFLYRPVLWNAVLHPDGVTGFAIVQDGNGDPIYSAANLNALLP